MNKLRICCLRVREKYPLLAQHSVISRGLFHSEFHQVPLIPVDHPGIPAALFPLDAPSVVQMGVPVEMESRLILVQQAVKGPEAGVGQIGAGHHVLPRRVSQQDVEPLFKK